MVGPWVVFKVVEPGPLLLVAGPAVVACVTETGANELRAGSPRSVEGLAEEGLGECSEVFGELKGPALTVTLEVTGSVALEAVLHCTDPGLPPEGAEVPGSVLCVIPAKAAAELELRTDVTNVGVTGVVAKARVSKVLLEVLGPIPEEAFSLTPCS